MSCKFSFYHIKISSRGLMIKHEQFDLNYSTNTLFHTKIYFENTVSRIVKLSVTIPKNHNSSVHLVNSHFTAIIDLIQTNTWFITKLHNFYNPISRGSHGCSNGCSKIHINSVPRFGTDQTAPHGLTRLKHS